MILPSLPRLSQVTVFLPLPAVALDSDGIFTDIGSNYSYLNIQTMDIQRNILDSLERIEAIEADKRKEEERRDYLMNELDKQYKDCFIQFKEHINAKSCPDSGKTFEIKNNYWVRIKKTSYDYTYQKREPYIVFRGELNMVYKNHIYPIPKDANNSSIIQRIIGNIKSFDLSSAIKVHKFEQQLEVKRITSQIEELEERKAELLSHE